MCLVSGIFHPKSQPPTPTTATAAHENHVVRDTTEASHQVCLANRETQQAKSEQYFIVNGIPWIPLASGSDKAPIQASDLTKPITKCKRGAKNVLKT
jgi:hypothetical protein